MLVAAVAAAVHMCELSAVLIFFRFGKSQMREEKMNKRFRPFKHISLKLSDILISQLQKSSNNLIN